MSNPESGFWSGPGRSDRDPVTGMFVAMRDAWLAGAAALESLSGPSAASGNPGMDSAGETMIGTVGPMADVTTANFRRLWGSGMAGGSTEGAPEPSVTADLVLPIGQAMVIAASRSASYWLGLAQILASHQTRSVRAIGAAAIEGGAAASQRVAAAEQLRALLREVGDLATREARILQNDLGNLGESLAQTLRQPDLSAPYRRRWRTKL
jgi:hypothetical protein